MLSEISFARYAAGAGKSARTRAQLMDAAVSVIAGQSIDGATVHEITKIAGVANGTFYAHFKDKDEIVSAVTEAIAVGIAKQLDELMTGIDCAITRVATGTRIFMDITCQNSDLGQAFLKAFYTLPEFKVSVGSFLRADIARGIEQGVFLDTIDDFVMECIGGLLASAAMSRLSGNAGPEAGVRAAELQLQLLGVDPETVRKVTSKPLDFT